MSIFKGLFPKQQKSLQKIESTIHARIADPEEIELEKRKDAGRIE
jgi:hypothetical protein